MEVELPRRIVVVPTYQEREALPRFLASFEPTGFGALVVDDASPDGTADWAEAYARDHPWLHVLRRGGKEGLGTAYRAGFAWCLERGYEVVGQMDADLSHPPDALAGMAAELERGADLVVGSRFVRGGKTVGWPRRRTVQSYAALLPARLLLRLPVVDVTGGFKLWRADALRRIEVETTVSQGYVFQIETAHRAARAGLRIVELPITFREREVGASKLSAAVKREGIAVVLRLARDPWRPR
ncbi:MAG: polyprenol monophosphomannose synthase [Thermoleophilia bacterium]|nr:polyprenol monophosphomannose synthase [Thermoleophilia bacterium]